MFVSSRLLEKDNDYTNMGVDTQGILRVLVLAFIVTLGVTQRFC